MATIVSTTSAWLSSIIGIHVDAFLIIGTQVSVTVRCVVFAVKDVPLSAQSTAEVFAYSQSVAVPRHDVGKESTDRSEQRGEYEYVNGILLSVHSCEQTNATFLSGRLPRH